jgi:hypothetical protein
MNLPCVRFGCFVGKYQFQAPREKCCCVFVEHALTRIGTTLAGSTQPIVFSGDLKWVVRPQVRLILKTEFLSWVDVGCGFASAASLAMAPLKQLDEEAFRPGFVFFFGGGEVRSTRGSGHSSADKAGKMTTRISGSLETPKEAGVLKVVVGPLNW